jgi:CDP-6-deoxy-D-xylo-4-hexulose-3-dehydrase
MTTADAPVPPAFLSAVRELRAAWPEPPSRYRLPLTVNTFGDEEIAAALEALVRGPMTMGPRVTAFEQRFARALGCADAVFCNSGSSANLLAMAELTRAFGRDGKPLLQPGDEVVVPAVTWSTTVWPVAQMGAIPVLADVSPETLNVTVESVERALSPRTRAVFAVHLLGNPAPVDALARLCAERGLVLLEDVCESLDAQLAGRAVGTFGRTGTFSFYFSHHICTIEGGMVACQDPQVAERLRILRAHGWTRHMSRAGRQQAEAASPEIDPRFLFVDLGYNLRGTDVQAAIGLVQFERRAGFLSRRREVAAAWASVRDELERIFTPIHFSPGASHFALPLILRPGTPATRATLCAWLEDRGVETRPLVAGNLARQPALSRVPHRVAGPLPGADLIHEQGLYVGIHPGLGDNEVAFLADALRSFAKETPT